MGQEGGGQAWVGVAWRAADASLHGNEWAAADSRLASAALQGGCSWGDLSSTEAARRRYGPSDGRGLRSPAYGSIG
jgi:hypothetical protein